jgi:heptosyltransferase-2
MIWHLPHIRAIAAHVGHPVTLITKPRSRADQIFVAEDAIRDVFWLDRNPEGRRGGSDGVIGRLRTITALRARKFTAIYLLHHSKTIALLAMLAGIPERFGYGYGVQARFLNRPPRLPASMAKSHPFDKATEWIRAAGIQITEAEPNLTVEGSALQTVRSRITTTPVAIGIGASEAYKQWSATRYAALADGLAARGFSSMVLVGGKAEAVLVEKVQSSVRTATITPAIDWSLQEIAAVLSLSAYYVGNDTGFMNMAAAVGIRTYCLFGALPPFYHSRRIVPITPPGGVSLRNGMAGISVEQVLAVIDADLAASGILPIAAMGGPRSRSALQR